MTTKKHGDASSAPVERKVMLLPCPHCGNNELRPHFSEYEGDYRNPWWWVECGKCPCGMQVYGETVDALISAWNMRITQNQPTAKQMYYRILEDWFHLEKGQIIDTHDSNQQIYLELMVKLNMAEIVEEDAQSKPTDGKAPD